MIRDPMMTGRTRIRTFRDPRDGGVQGIRMFQDLMMAGQRDDGVQRINSNGPGGSEQDGSVYARRADVGSCGRGPGSDMMRVWGQFRD